MKRRFAAVFLVCFAAYASTIGLHAFGDSDYGGDEPHYLLTAKSLVDDGDVDLLDEYTARSYASFYPYLLDPHGQLTDRRLNEPHGVGFPLLIAPAYAAGGAKAVELFLAVLAALAVALGYLLAARAVPDPWALAAALAVGLSPPFLAYGSAVYPELAAGAALAGAALLALRLEDRPGRADTFGCFALLGLLPWLGVKYVPAAVLIGFFAVRALRRNRRALLAFGGAEVALFSVAFFVGVNEALYGGPTPYSADVAGQNATQATFPWGYAERSYRLVALFFDRGYGLLRWAPLFLLAFTGAWLLWRASRERLAVVLPSHRRAESTAALSAAALLAALLVGTFLAPTMFGFWFAGRHIVWGLVFAIPLIAWGLRHAPRAGAVLGALTLAASGWLWAYVRWEGGGLVGPLPDAPWGPLLEAFPLFAGAAWPYVFAAVVALAVASGVAWELLRDRRTAAI